MLLSIENLRTYFYSRSRRAFVRSVDGASLGVARGETLGVVGESGSGKTVAALSAAGLVTGAPGAGRTVAPAELGKLAAFSGVSEFPMRVKCATLAWHTLKAALDNGGTVSTE